MTMALRYSILPYPKGCFLSASFPASFVPTIVMMELAASDRLFTASITIAMEFDASPTNALNAARKILARMPMMLVLMIVLSLLVCPFMTSAPCINAPAGAPCLYIRNGRDTAPCQWNGWYIRFLSHFPAFFKTAPQFSAVI